MQLEKESEHFGGAVAVFKPQIFQDERGFFSEVFRKDQFEELGFPGDFVQWNHSGSVQGVLRGLHFQWDPPMGKLMRVNKGEAFLVAVDIRKGSPTVGEWFGTRCSAEDRRMVYAPASFARGFCVTSEHAEIEYLCSGTYNPECESGIRYDDPRIGVDWPRMENPIISDKDRKAQTLDEWLERPESDHFTYKG